MDNCPAHEMDGTRSGFVRTDGIISGHWHNIFTGELGGRSVLRNGCAYPNTDLAVRCGWAGGVGRQLFFGATKSDRVSFLYKARLQDVKKAA